MTPRRPGFPTASIAPNAAMALVALVLAAALLPTLLTPIPALTDYPNHLARMSILVRNGTAAAHPYYQVAWGLYPNLAMDLVVPLLARLMEVPAATWTFYALSQLLVLSGAMAVGYAAQRSVILPALVAALFLYAPPFAWGFVNFAFGLGLALWAFAVWIGLMERPLPVRLAVHAGFVAALFLAHLVALGLYGLMAGAYELWRLRQAGAGWRRWLATLAGMVLPVLLLLLAMMASGGSIGGSGNEWFFANKPAIVLEPNGFDRRWSLAVSIGLGVGLILAVGRGLVRLSSAGAWVGGILLAAFVLMPGRLFDTSFVDGRVWLALVLVVPAFVHLSGTARQTSILLGALAVLALANSLYTARLQHSYATDYRAMLAALEKVPKGARILIARTGPEDDPPDERLDYPMFHAAMLGVHTRDALVPTLFAYPGKQPVLPRPEVSGLTIPQGGPVPLDILLDIARGGRNPTNHAFLSKWPEKFGYLVLLKAEGNPLPGYLELIAADLRFSLFRIRPLAP
jgi:hypothetical protein